jgi:DNA-binding CsgD family transcriptional regulator
LPSLPPGLQRASIRYRQLVLVGRGAAVVQVRQAIDEVGVVAVVGPAGIGKTAVARAAVGNDSRHTGALHTTRMVPLFPIRRLLGQLHLNAELTVNAAVRSVLRAGHGPVLIDDLQWADEATLEAIALLTGHLPMVVTIRSGEERSDEVTGLLSLLGARQVDLGPLGTADAQRLLDDLHPTLTDEARHRVLRAAKGNPLLLGELPKGPSSSPTLAGALLARLMLLSSAGRDAAERLAVLGRPASAAVLGPGTAELVDSGFSQEADGAIDFVHGLLGEVVAEELGPRADDLRRLLAPMVPSDEAARLLHTAGDRHDARVLALEAASCEPDPLRRAELLVLAVQCADDADAENRVAAARLLIRASQPQRALDLCDISMDHLAPLEQGMLHGATGAAAWALGRYDLAAERLPLAMAELAGSRTQIEVEILAGSTAIDTFVALDGRPALARAEAAVALADELGVSRAYARARLASVRMMAGTADWEAAYVEAMELARAEGDDDVHGQAFVGLVLATWTQGDVARATELARAEMAARRPEGFDLPWLGVAAFAGLLSVLAGMPPTEVLATFAPILDREPFFRNRAFLEAAVLVALCDAGAHPAAARRSAGAVDRAGNDPQGRSIAMWGCAEAAWHAGRHDELKAIVDALVDLGLGDYPSAVMARLVGAHSARERGSPLRGAAPTIGLPAWRAAPIEWEALEAASASEAEIAAERFVRAADAWAPCDRRSELRCRWAAGDVAAAGGLPAGVALLEDALRRALASGSTSMANRIRRSLRAAGAPVRTTSTRTIAGLTERETEVLDLAGAGMHTTQIASALGIATSTVESTVRQAKRKLGSPTRTAAAAELARRRSMLTD